MSTPPASPSSPGGARRAGGTNRATPDPARFDPWSGRGTGTARWLAASTVLHVGLLALFATVSITVVRTIEKINVKVLDEEATAAPPTADDGAPALEDLAGVLDVAPAPRQRARIGGGPAVRNVRAPEIPRLGGVGPRLGAGPQVDVSSAPLSVGSGGIGGLGGGFGDYVGGLRKVGLDLVLVIDTTESMQFVIDDVKERLSNLVASIQRMVPTSRVGIVVYRDRGDEYVVKWTDLSFRTAKLRDFLANIRADGGGDWEEAVKEGLDAAMNELTWRKKARRVIVLVGGSPPHAGDLPEIEQMVRAFKDARGALSAIDVTEPMHAEFERATWRTLHGNTPFRASPLPDFYQQVSEAYGRIAREGGGDLIRLGADKEVIRQILVLTFGSRWQTEMAKYLGELS